MLGHKIFFLGAVINIEPGALRSESSSRLKGAVSYNLHMRGIRWSFKSLIKVPAVILSGESLTCCGMDGAAEPLALGLESGSRLNRAL